MKQQLLFYSAIFFLCVSYLAGAQNNPTFDSPAKDTVIVNSGSNYLTIPNISDGDSEIQELSFEVTSSDESILTINSVSYTAGDKLALIWVEEQSIIGTVSITVSVTDEDGTTTKDFDVVISEYTHHGIKFEIHDAIFWQEVVPVSETPIYQKIVQTTNMGTTYNTLNWLQIPLTVSAGCGSASLCDGHDFSTGFIEGFLVPKVSGLYRFYINGANDYGLWFSSSSNLQNASVIAAKSDEHGTVGAVVNDTRQSGAISLDSGKVYAIYAAQWNVHQETGGVQWELPGEFGPEDIDGAYLYPEWDTQRPVAVNNVQVSSIGDEFFRITWNTGSDNQKLEGYNVYLNGLKVNSGLITKTEYTLNNLEASTKYSVTVTSIDHVNNESNMSAIVNVETLELDTIPPSPPNSLSIDEATGLALKISWSGSIDGETSIYGYNVYLDGELYNTNDFVYNNTTILKVLSPEKEYKVEIEAVDAGLNISEKSEVFVVSTVVFDPLDVNLGLKTGRLIFSEEAISFNEGLGVNPDYKSGAVFNDAHTMLFEDLKPGGIRWGALTANPLSFSEYTGAGKNVTIGKFFERCNEFGSYTVFCCGVENGTDWRQKPETFIRFLEYINGPDSTLGGKLRIAEGYTEPFLENSPGLIFEFGNEVWGANAHNAQIGGDYNQYAAWCREIAAMMKKSEYYDSTKIYLTYSSRRPSREDSYGLNDKIINGNDGILEWTAPSGYLGGNLNYDPAFPPVESELEYYQNVRDRANDYLNGIFRSHKYEVQATGRLMPMYFYESNTTTPTYNGRLGQALLSTDYYLTSMELASAIPTIFHLTGGQWRITEPENDYNGLPLFLTARYFNHLCKGDVLDNTYESNEDGTSGTGADATFSNRPVGVHTYRNDSGYTIVLISRDYVNDHYVQVDFPDDFSHSPEGKQYLLTGDDFSTKVTIIDTIDIAIEDGMLVKVPKYSMIFIHFGAENIEMANLPLAYYPYPKIEEIDINIIRGGDTFTQPLEYKQFSATISPTDSWDKSLKWTLLHNSGNYNVTPLGLYCTVTARSELENETDSLILRASSRIGDVYEDFVLYVPKAVGIRNIKNNSGFKFYPNPARDKITIDLPEKDILRIYSVTGILMFEKEVVAGRQEIMIKNLSEGIYTVRVGDKSRRLIIAK